MKRHFASAILLVGVLLYAWFPVRTGYVARNNNDFKHIYLGAQRLLERESPYSAESLFLQAHRSGLGNTSLNPYVYLPFTGLSLGFLAPLSFESASGLFFFINHLLVLAGCWLLCRELFPRSHVIAFSGCLIALAVSHPWFRTLTAGQLNAVLFFCYAVAFVLLRRNRDTAAGATLGFAAMFKLAPGIFLLYFALRRQWRAFSAMGATCALLLLLSIAAVGIQPHLDFIPMLRQMSYGHSTWEDLPIEHPPTFWKDPPNQSANSLLTHLLVANNGMTQPVFSLSQNAANAATWVFSAAVLGIYLIRHQRRRNLKDGDSLFFATVLLSLLLPSLMWDHYLVIALLPVLWLVSLRHRPLAVAAALCYVAIAAPWHYDAPAFRHGAGIFLMSIKLFPTLALFLLCLAAPKLILKPATTVESKL